MTFKHLLEALNPLPLFKQAFRNLIIFYELFSCHPERRDAAESCFLEIYEWLSLFGGVIPLLQKDLLGCQYFLQDVRINNGLRFVFLGAHHFNSCFFFARNED
jgi:hypothetical protein